MQSLWRQPVLTVGIVLLIVGMGNWLVSRNKILEYTERRQASNAIGQIGSLKEFPELTPRTNATLLKRLHRGLGDATLAEAKLDFYTVVHSGGRLFSALGLLLISLALLQRWRLQRLRRVMAPPMAGTASDSLAPESSQSRSE